MNHTVISANCNKGFVINIEYNSIRVNNVSQYIVLIAEGSLS